MIGPDTQHEPEPAPPDRVASDSAVQPCVAAEPLLADRKPVTTTASDLILALVGIVLPIVIVIGLIWHLHS